MERTAQPLIHGDITGRIISAAVEVHRALGPGLLESAYESCLAHEITNSGLAVVRQVSVPLVYKSCTIDCGYRMDMVVEGTVIVELKAIERLLPIHEAQLNTYLRLSGLRVALLFNFNALRMA